MNDDQITPQAIAGVSGLPLPAGTDDNGNPYWMIDGRKVLWAEMQQYIWQEQQKQKPVSTGGGVEGLSQVIMPNIEAQLVAQPNPEVIAQPESRIETAQERGVESGENRQERAIEQQAQTVNAPGTQPQAASASQQKAPSLLGDSPVLTQVDTSSPASIVSYVDSHHKDAPDNSSRFLSELLEKIVKVFSLEH